MKQQRFSVAQLTQMALLVALLVVSGFIRIPLPFTPTPITAQTLIINLIAILLLPSQTAMTIGTYLALGLIGLPIFGGSGGIGYFAGPTGGYLVGYLVGGILMSVVYHRLQQRKERPVLWAALTTVLVGMPVIYLLGSIWMSVVMQTTVVATILTAILPYILGDLSKCAAAIVLAVPIQKALKRANVTPHKVAE